MVQEASQPWPVLAEKCYQALEHDRVEFHDLTGRCSVASAGAAAMGLGLCVLAAPEIVAGAVVVTGVVVVGLLIKEALDTYEPRRGRPWGTPAPGARPMPETRPVPVTKHAPPRNTPKPEPKGPDFPPVGPTEVAEGERRRRCEPIPVPYHLGGNKLHDTCADNVPNNSNPGGDVFVNGKNFDALQLATRTLWEVKTNDIDTYKPFVRRSELQKQVEEANRERALAVACGYQFAIGVRTEMHKQLLKALLPDFDIMVMTWC
ncbi:DUF6310 domain-containing protein [Melittangium boletus]|uniref:DUF6310 domain-containing protein n=1 Tax=Melittangium boletus TaxID=83453 RepID=UPI003DA6130C